MATTDKTLSMGPSLVMNEKDATPQSEMVAPSYNSALFSNENPTIDGSSNPAKTPFLQPVSDWHPSPSSELTQDQKSKYETVLSAAIHWTEIPSSTAHGSLPSVLDDNERLWLSRECILRYLRASKWVVPTAITRLQATLIWRREYGVEAHTADYISEENETGKQVLLGFDYQGRPCLYLNPHKQNTKRSDKQIQHLVFMLERCIDLMPPGQETLALLVNFKESRSGENASIGQGRQTISILQNHYPERLGRALVQNVPWLVRGFFTAIGPFIDPQTKEKLKFDENLRQLVPPQQLIKAYSGDVEFQYEHEIYWPALNALAETRRKEMFARWEKVGKRLGESESYLKGDPNAIPIASDPVK